MESNNRLNTFKNYIIYITVLTVSILSIVLIAFDVNIEDGYQLLWALPLLFMIASIICTSIMSNIRGNLSIAIIWSGYFIRFVLTPLILRFGNYQVAFHTLTRINIEKAIFLMSHEIIIVFFSLEIYLRNTNAKYRVSNKKINEGSTFIVNKERNKTLHFNLIILSLLCIVIVLYIPQIRDSFTWIFSNKSDISNIDYNIDNIAIRGTIKRALSSIFVFIFDIIRYMIPVYLLECVYRRFKNSIAAYFLSTIICLLPFLAISGSNVQPFIGLIINVIMMSKLYPGPSRKMIKMYIIVGGALLVSILASKIYILGESRGVSGLDSLSLTINAYFPGIGNAAATLNIDDNNKLKTLFYDLFSTIPFRYSIFPSIAGKEVRLSDLFDIYNLTSGHIIPCISGSEYYLGPLLAPVLPSFLSCFSVKLKAKAEASKSYWEYFYFIFFSIRVAFIPNLYSHISFVIIIINVFIPMYCLYAYFNRSDYRKI